MDKFDLTKKDDAWVLQKAHSNRSVVRADTKVEAVKASADYLKQRPEGGSMNIHKENGRFQKEQTYPRSKDPRKTPG